MAAVSPANDMNLGWEKEATGWYRHRDQFRMSRRTWVATSEPGFATSESLNDGPSDSPPDGIRIPGLDAASQRIGRRRAAPQPLGRLNRRGQSVAQ